MSVGQFGGGSEEGLEGPEGGPEGGPAGGPGEASGEGLIESVVLGVSLAIMSDASPIELMTARTAMSDRLERIVDEIEESLELSCQVL